MKPILFSTPMVQAILNGTKTQTRRVVKPQPANKLWIGVKSNEWHEQIAENHVDLTKQTKCPYGRAGEFLWVRESFTDPHHLFPQNGYVYKANMCEPQSIKWKPSIHMPFTACRLFLKIKSIKVERLQDITEADAKAEGVKQNDIGYYENYLPVEHPQSFKLATKSFCSLWFKINGIDSWDANPFVWVIEFERTEKPLPLTT